MFARHRTGGETDAEQAGDHAGTGRPAVVLAATFALDPVAPFLRDALRHLHIPHEVRTAPYGQLVEQFLSPQGPFATNTGGVNIALVRLSDWTPAPHRESHLESHREVHHENHEIHRETVMAFASAVREFAAFAATPTLVAICPEAPGRELPT